MDEVLLEVRGVRGAFAKQFGYNFQAIHHDLKEQEKKSGRRIVCLPPRRARRSGPITSDIRPQTKPVGQIP